MNEFKLKKSVATIKVPEPQIDFLKKNPKIAQVVGKTIMELNQVYQMIDYVKERLSDASSYEQFLENGTKEELAEFLKVVVEKHQELIIHDNIPEGHEEEILAEIEKAHPGGFVRTDLKNTED